MTVNGTDMYDALGTEVPALVSEAVVRWLEHPALFTTEVSVAEGFAVLIGRRRPV